MNDMCYYCQKDTHTEAYPNPHTNEIHPTCKQCKLEFTSFYKERMFFTKIGCVWGPLFILVSIILSVINWKIGWIVLLISLLIEIVAFFLQEYFVKKKEIACGTYVDVKKLQWCKTCRNFRKVKNYEKIPIGLWQSNEMLRVELIPCKIVEQTFKIWEEFFSLEQQKRTLYPKKCLKWEKR